MSDVKIIATKDAPAAIGPYVQGKVIGGFLFASGQIPLVPATGAMAEGGIAEQARQALNNVKALVEAAKQTSMTSSNTVTMRCCSDCTRSFFRLYWDY